MAFVLNDHGSKRSCGSCEHWVKSIMAKHIDGYQEAPCSLGVIDSQLPVKAPNPQWHRGSWVCGKWTKEIKL